jgi:hypothetical protein
MRSLALRRPCLASLCVSFTLVAACKSDGSQDDGGGASDTGSASNPSGGGDGGEAGGTDAADDSGTDAGTDGGGDDGGDDGAADEPHARGTIVLGESHLPESANSSPIVSASFVPDFLAQPQACGTSVAGCFVQTLPDCGGQCEFDEFCTFNAECASTCERICDLPCGDDEVCYFPVADNPACKRIEYFDAGALKFTGTTVPVTLFPPYNFQGDVTGALYLPSSEVAVHATGATEAGFEAFEQSFTTTTYMDATVEELGLEEIYGDGPLPVSWVAGGDEVRVTLTVTGLSAGYGTITCDAEDAAGAFDLPREAIAAALPGDEQLGGMSLSVERRRSELHKGLTTKGELLEHTVQPVGWLELVSTSVESVTVTGCGGLAYCDGECIDVQYDAQNCSGCGDACSADAFCESGECYCSTGVECDGECVDPWSDPDHCGDCDIACDANESCLSGSCVPEEPDPTDGGGDDGGGGVGNCCAAHMGPGCTNDTIEQCVCAQDAYCCNTAWDATCANEVEAFDCGMC